MRERQRKGRAAGVRRSSVDFGRSQPAAWLAESSDRATLVSKSALDHVARRPSSVAEHGADGDASGISSSDAAGEPSSESARAMRAQPLPCECVVHFTGSNGRFASANGLDHATCSTGSDSDDFNAGQRLPKTALKWLSNWVNDAARAAALVLLLLFLLPPPRH